VLNNSEFQAYVKALNLPARGIEFLQSVRCGGIDGQVSPAARRVESHVGNSIVRYPSVKMGFVVECESGRVEYVAALALEDDDDVLE